MFLELTPPLVGERLIINTNNLLSAIAEDKSKKFVIRLNFNHPIRTSADTRFFNLEFEQAADRDEIYDRLLELLNAKPLDRVKKSSKLPKKIN